MSTEHDTSFPRRAIALAVATLSVAFGLLTAVSVPASADAGRAHNADDAPQYCVLVVGKAAAGKPSPVRSRACSSDPATSRRQAAVSSSSTPLMDWRMNCDGCGNHYWEITTIYGDAGPCDFEGYSIRITDSDWRNTISSFSTRAGCNAVIGWDTQSFSGLSWSWGDPNAYTLDIDYVGSTMNDRIESFSIWQN